MTAPLRGRQVTAGAAPAAIAIALALSGCGSSTKTVHVSSASPRSAMAHDGSTSISVTTASTTAGSETARQAPSTVTTVTQTQHVASSRTSSEPAFVEEEGAARNGALGAAVALVEREGYAPTSTSEYHQNQTLRVLTATAHDGAGGERAFFFVDGRYIGTDASEPSASISVISQSDTEVVLGYGLYDGGEARVGQAEVRFQLNDGKLQALDAIPPVRPSASAAGRL